MSFTRNIFGKNSNLFRVGGGLIFIVILLHLPTQTKDTILRVCGQICLEGIVMKKKTNRANADIREAAHQKGVYIWEIAAKLGVSEAALFKWLRVELEPERRQQILEVIEELSVI